MADLLRRAAIEDAETDNRRAATGREVMQRVQNKGEIGLGFERQHARGGKAFVIDQGLGRSDPSFHRIGEAGSRRWHQRARHREMPVFEGVAVLDVELVIVHVVQEHVHAGEL